MRSYFNKILRFTCFFTLILCVSATTSVDQQSVKVKSAYLINFVRFINWPESKKEKVSLGFLGDNKQ